MKFPVVKTKITGIKTPFDLTTIPGRRDYFDAKVGEEIHKLRKYFKENSVVLNMIGKKNSGKGTYTKMFLEAVGVSATHFSIGDLVRENIKEREMGKLLSTDVILELLQTASRNKVEKLIILDGLPRNLEQIEHAINIRSLLDLEPGRDLFVLIDIPEKVMDMRMKNRVICPICKTPRSPRLLPNKHVHYDRENDEIFMCCDKDGCQLARMVPKEGDDLGIEAIRERLNEDGRVIDEIVRRDGVDKILLSASVPVGEKDSVDDYEIHLIYDLKLDKRKKNVKVESKHWIFKDDNGNDSYTLFPPAVTTHMIREMVRILKI